VIVDALHLARSGGTPADVAALVARTPGRFPVVHLCDAPAVPRSDSPEALAEESREDRLLPGDGELPLLRLLAATAGSRAFVEAPVRASSGVAFAERARRAAAALANLGSHTADA
jgi:sugar phosphate isomerase/epimerase